MDAPNLQENFIDDILSPSNTVRKYRLINNAASNNYGTYTANVFWFTSS